MPIEVPENVQQWFDAQNMEVRLFPEQAVKKFKSLSRLYDFIEKEKQFWEPIDKQIHQIFHRALSQINSALSSHSNEAQFQPHLRSAISELTTFSRQNNQCIVFSKTKLAKELKTISEKYGQDGYRAFFDAILFDRLTRHFGNRPKEEFFGLIDAYVYHRLNDRLIEQVADSESSLSEIQSQFNSFFDVCEKGQVGRQVVFQGLAKDWKARKQSSEDEFKAQAAGFDASNSNQMAAQQKQFDDNEALWKQRITELEDLYQSKLMLEAPVEYWTQMEVKYREAGNRFAGATAVALVAMVAALSTVLYKWPPTWLQSETWDWNTLKGSFLLLTIASLAIYVVRFLAKFALSSYHLARDAEERKQLTYVYLSLLQKNAVSEEQQQIILQALFSRADTGLLKGDHGPTMPSVLSSLVDRG